MIINYRLIKQIGSTPIIIANHLGVDPKLMDLRLKGKHTFDEKTEYNLKRLIQNHFN